MSGKVLMSLLVSVVLGDVVEVFAADDEGTVHLGGNDGAGQDTATDGDVAGEGALLVCLEQVLLEIPISCAVHKNTQVRRSRIDRSSRARRIIASAIILGSFANQTPPRSSVLCNSALRTWVT